MHRLLRSRSGQVEMVGAPRVSKLETRLAGRHDRWFFTAMATIAALIVFAGFARSYYLRAAFEATPLSLLLHVHGLVFTTWILLFVAQTTLVATRRTGVHRRLGLAGVLLAATMVVVGIMTAIASAQSSSPPTPGLPARLPFLAVPLGQTLLFGGFAGAALYLRRKPTIHKRLMLLATITLLTPAIARIPGIQGAGLPVYMALTDVFIVACWLYDRLAHGRIHPAFLWPGLLLIASQPFRLWLGQTEAWLVFARWLTG